MYTWQDWKNAVDNLEMGWTNQWVFLDQREILLAKKSDAFKKIKSLLRERYNVIDIYKQLEEFDLCIKKQKGLTDDEEEKILLAVAFYAECNRPIISSSINSTLAELDTPQEKEKSALRYKYDIYTNLISFYLGYKEELNLFDTFVKFLRFNEELLSKYPSEKSNFYSVPYTISYLKFLIKKKQFDKSEYILSNFTIIPTGKMDTASLEKIKEKIAKEKNKWIELKN